MLFKLCNFQSQASFPSCAASLQENAFQAVQFARPSVFVKLPRLGQQPGFDALLERLRLECSSRFNESRYSGIFDIANSERLGQSEVQLINTMINGVGRLIALEKRLEKGEKIDLEQVH